MNELMLFEEIEFKESEIKPTILQNAKIEFNETWINSLIEKYEQKYANIIIRVEDEKKFDNDRKKINKAIEDISTYRKQTQKEIQKPIDDFVTKYKEVEKRLKVLSDNISKQLNEFKENLFNERNEKMKEIKEKIVKELEIENLSKLISIPEQKGILARSSYSDSKAEKIIREQVEEIQKQYKNLKTLVELESVKNGIQLNADDYILVMDNEEEVKSRIEFQIKAVRENEERIKRQEQERIQKELAEKEKQDSIEKINSVIKESEEKVKRIAKSKKILSINLYEVDKATQKALKEFLDINKINYILTEL